MLLISHAMIYIYIQMFDMQIEAKASLITNAESITPLSYFLYLVIFIMVISYFKLTFILVT